MLSSLHHAARSLYSSMREVPFEIAGSCRALVYREHGSPKDALRMEHGYLPRFEGMNCQDASNLVHLKILAAPVNPSDINQIQGNYPLTSPGNWHVGGNEGVAVVCAIGDGVQNLKVGDWVIPRSSAFGTWREQVICSMDDIQKIPNDLPLPVAASLLVNPPTAFRLLEDFVNLKEGDYVIQNGANSAVGRYIIQLAKSRGIKTINIIRDRPNYEVLERELIDLGATHVVKSTEFAKQETQEYLVKLIQGRPIIGFNCVGGVAVTEMARFLADGSTIVTYGGMAGKNPVISAASLIFRDITYSGFWMSRWYQKASQDPNLNTKRIKMMEEIFNLFRKNIFASPQMEFYEFSKDWSNAVNHYDQHSSSSNKMKPCFLFTTK